MNKLRMRNPPAAAITGKRPLKILASNQFLFGSGGEKLAAFVGEHRAARNGFAACLDDDMDFLPGIAVAISPAFVFDTDISDFGDREALQKQCFKRLDKPYDDRELSRQRIT